MENFGQASDVVLIGADVIKPSQAAGDEALDEWMCRWEGKHGNDQGQVKGYPLEDFSRMDKFPWPDGNDPARYKSVPKQLEDLSASLDLRDKYVRVGGIKFLWERMQYLHGFENCMIDMLDGCRQVEELADRILQYHLDLVRNLHRICGSRVQGFRFSDDWGTQANLHISPELWDRFFMPRYRKLFEAVHECGWHVWMHSCGKINKIIGRLVDLGVDLLNMWQPRVNGIEQIGQEFAGKVCFETLCDIQSTLPAGKPAEIEAEAELLLRSWATPEGGFLLGGYSLDSVGAPPGTEEFVLKTFRRLDPYQHGWS